jgi:hypothetical protein
VSLNSTAIEIRPKICSKNERSKNFILSSDTHLILISVKLAKKERTHELNCKFDKTYQTFFQHVFYLLRSL